MRRIGAAALVALAALAPGALADDGAVGAKVAINFGSVTPTQTQIVAGEAVQWTNESVRNHTVTADDGAFDSGVVSPSTQFQHAFADTGTFAYHCRLHPYIRGEVDVYRVLLDRPVAPAGVGRAYPLSGRAALPADTPVSIEFDDGSGSGFQPAADTTVGADGRFSVSITPRTSGSYRALAGGETSPPVQLVVLDRSVDAVARRVRGGTRVSAVVAPAAPGQTVVLQLHLKERFGWWPVAQRKLGKDSRAMFRLRLHRHVAARVLLTLPDAATPLAISKTLRVGPLP